MSVADRIISERETSIWERPLWAAMAIDWEKVLYAGIFIVAVVSRLWMIGERAMSHDESLHTQYSWYLFKGRGFQHSPLMHGNFKFHLTALFYWLLGDSDASSRIPMAVFGIALVMLPILLRRWLGRAGALATSFLFLISPSILYYARYIRDEPLMILWGALIFWSFLRYEQTKEARWLYVLAAATSLMFTTMEAAYIYVGIFALFLLMRFVVQTITLDWNFPEYRTPFFVAVAATVLIGAFTALHFQNSGGMAGGFDQTLSILIVLTLAAAVAAVVLVLLGLREDAPSDTTELERLQGARQWLIWATLGAAVLALLLLLLRSALSAPPLAGLGVAFGVWLILVLASTIVAAAGVALLLTSLPLVYEIREGVRNYASLELIVVFGTLVLPQFAALVVKRLGYDPLDYSDAGIINSAKVLVPLLLLSLILGLIWNWRRWLIAAGIFYATFVTLFTTVFTNPQGVASGIMGGLGYWMVQQGVKRGDQPTYYYFVVMPIYEFLPLILSFAAIVYYAVRRWRAHAARRAVEWADGAVGSDYFVLFCAWWLFMSFVLYSYAGEKMPWLMTHIATPAVFLGGWVLGQFIGGVDWRAIWNRGGWAIALLLILSVFAFPALASTEAFAGQAQPELTRTTQWLSSLLIIAGALVGIFLLWRRIGTVNALRVVAAVGVLALVVATIRTAYRANYINFDNTKEYLVYAHGAPAIKQVMNQIEEISLRTTGDLNLKIAHDDDSSWPFTWYLRNYPNNRYMGASASSDIRQYPVVIVGDKNYAKFDPYLRDSHNAFEYIFLWWPMEDYKNLTWERISYALINPQMRAAVWDIFINRDFEKYGKVKQELGLGTDTYALTQCPLRHSFKLYVDKKVSAQLWERSVGPVAPVAPPPDVYGPTRREIAPVQVFGVQGAGQGQFNRPRNVAVGPDGSIYVADTDNHRIQKFDAEGQFVLAWGTKSPEQPEPGAPPGQFNEPWGVAVDADGNVYVADTWNHRVQKFSSDGQFVTQWGVNGVPGPEDPTLGPGQFWGPRGIAVGSDGNVYIADTGNKRIQVFSADGQFVRAFGGGGPLDGQLEEPVGVAVGSDGNVYVADTWNQRVQVFSQGGQYLRQWKVEQGWMDSATGDNQHNNNKPYLAVDGEGRVYVTDPMQYRVMVYRSDGSLMANFGTYGPEPNNFTLPTGIAVDEDGNIYIADTDNHKIMKFGPIQ
jgi:uncharacterized protein (TIGR03663 family)